MVVNAPNATAQKSSRSQREYVVTSGTLSEKLLDGNLEFDVDFVAATHFHPVNQPCDDHMFCFDIRRIKSSRSRSRTVTRTDGETTTTIRGGR